MEKSLFNYYLPKELIAQTPLDKRSDSKLLIFDRQKNTEQHTKFSSIESYFNAGDVLVLNNTKVIPARLYGNKQTGAKIEIFLLKDLGQNNWEVLVRPLKRLKEGDMVHFNKDEYCTLLEKKPNGNAVVHFVCKDIFTLGEVPLPHYIENKLDDMQRYNTVYSKESGSVAAPTAGLHFTEQILNNLKDKGVIITYVTLHVGIGTFRPVQTENIKDHTMHEEFYDVSEQTAEVISKAKAEGRRVIAVGTTSVRTLESVHAKHGKVVACKDSTSIFIYPPYKFGVVDGIITNFHLPESTLIMLVSAFCGREKTLQLYNTAVKEKYRFFSFGDSMFIF